MKRIIASALGLTLIGLFAAPASAEVIFYFDTGIDAGNPDPSGTPPWATLTINDSGVDTVTMTITHVADADPGQFLRTLLLNISGFSGPYSASSGDAGFSSASFGEDSQNPGGYDMQVSFASAGADRVTAGESVTWTVSGAGLTENSFLSLAANDGLYGRLHIQGIDDEYSQWVTANPVPEPASIAALGIGALGLLRRRKKA